MDQKDDKIWVLAFILPQGVPTTANKNLGMFLKSVDEVERQIGLDFLSELPNGIEDRIEAKKAAGLW